LSETYSVRKVTVDSFETIRLSDVANGIEVSIIPAIGNNAYDMRVNGKPIVMSPPPFAEWKQKKTQAGIPFLAPWANRLDGDGYWANGKRYLVNPAAVEIRRDRDGLPIHGLLLFAPGWQVSALHADERSAEVVSRLEFWKHPEWMAQFPFAHTIEMTHRLSDGILEVRTTVENHSTEPMPLVVGFHPWYQIPETPRDRWSIHLPVREHYTLSQKVIPTGETTPVNLPDPTPLAGRHVDDVFGGVDASSEFWLEGDGRRVSVRFGPKFPIAIIYAPQTQDVVCFEPMTGLTDGFNLAHEGIFKNLQSVPPGEAWTESFWIRPSAF
jgi:aldose 1-epimerase